jgi:hypothetical protein
VRVGSGGSCPGVVPDCGIRCSGDECSGSTAEELVIKNIDGNNNNVSLFKIF